MGLVVLCCSLGCVGLVCLVCFVAGGYLLVVGVGNVVLCWIGCGLRLRAFMLFGLWVVLFALLWFCFVMFVLVWVVSRLWLLPDLFAVLGFGWCVVWFAFVSGGLGFGVLCFALGGLLCWGLDVLPCRMVAVLNDLPILDGGVCGFLCLRV